MRLSRSLVSSWRVRSTSCRSTATCCFKFLQPHFRLLLNFLEQGQLLGLDPLPHQFLGDACEVPVPGCGPAIPEAGTGSFPWPPPIPASAWQRPDASSTVCISFSWLRRNFSKTSLCCNQCVRRLRTRSSRLAVDLMGWNSLPSTTRSKFVFHGRQAVALDTKDAGDDFIVERFPQFVDRRDRVVEGQQGLEARAMQGGNRPAEDGVVAARDRAIDGKA